MSAYENVLGTWHSTFLAYDPGKKTFIHTLMPTSPLFYEICDSRIALLCSDKDERKYMAYTPDVGFFPSDNAFFFDLIENAPGSIGIKLEDKFLSARENGSISLMDWNNVWEQFSIGSSHKHGITSLYFGEYMRRRGDKPLSLVCCCGPMPYADDWFSTDIQEDPAKHIFMLDIASAPFPFANNTFNYIFIEHGTEHVDLEGLGTFINESFRILKPNGVLRIATPSLENWIKYYLFNSEEHDRITNFVYDKWMKKAKNMGLSNKALPFNNVMHNFCHVLVLDFETHKNILIKAGFVSVTREKMHVSNWRELNNIERRSDYFSEFETLVMEARK